MGDVRLYDSAALARILGPETEPFVTHECALVLKAYQKWGLACVEHLDGDFCFAIRDEAKQLLFLCVDPMGSRPLCYWQAGNRFAFARDPAQLLKIPEIPRRLNGAKIADMLLPHRAESREAETFHAGIFSLAPGSSLSFDQHGLRLRTYWEPEIRPELVPKNEREAFETVRCLLIQSVRNRLQKGESVASLLSGGLDSSAVTAIAAQELAAGNSSLLALSSVLSPDAPAGLRDEREFIGEFRSFPNVRLESVTAPGRGPFDHIENPEWCESTFLRSSRYYLYEAFDEKAAANGSSVILDGTWGEFGPTTRAEGYYLELAAGIRWKRLAASMRDGVPAAVFGYRAARVLAREFLNFLRPDHGYRPPIVLNPQVRPASHARSGRKRKWPNHQQIQLEAFRRIRARHANRVGLEMGRIPVRSPLLDRSVIEFCLALPGEMKVRGGYRRYLIRAALEGILPPKLQWRTGKMPFSPDYYVRYNAQLYRAKELVSSIRASDPVRSLVDVDRLSQLLQPVDVAAGSGVALTEVPATINLICFLRQFAEFR